MHSYFSKIAIFSSLIFCLISSSVNAQTVITRGPYLQANTSNSIKIKWRTSQSVPSRVQYGISPVILNQQVLIPGNRTEHEVLITGLNANTKYYYNVGTDQNILAVSPNYHFKTNPTLGSNDQTIQMWVLGDCGTGNNDQRAVRDGFKNYMVGKGDINGIILLGDNAYDFGTDGQYQDAFFQNMYEDIICNKTIWPCPGNHDYYSGADAATQTGPYYDIFAPTKNGEAGGLASNTEAYYSYNIGNTHFISLDSHDSSRDSTGAQATWLKADLAQNQSDFTIVYFHHAPYTKGSHNSDNPFPFIDGELPEMRQEIMPILERYGVDLVLSGHSHSYERSYLLNGHYGNSNTLTPAMKIQNTGGEFPGSCPYHKKAKVGQRSKGTVYAVCGVSGKISGTSSGWPHPAMFKSTVDHYGSMLLTVNKNRLDAKFITSQGTVWDQFTIIKNAGKKEYITICQGEEIELTPSYPGGNYTFYPGGNANGALTMQPPISTTIYGRDNLGCIRDTFVVDVVQQNTFPDDNCGPNTLNVEYLENLNVNLYPNPWNGIGTLIVKLDESIEHEGLKLYTIDGNEIGIIAQSLGNGEIQVQLKQQNILAGTYILQLKTKTGNKHSKIILTP